MSRTEWMRPAWTTANWGRCWSEAVKAVKGRADEQQAQLERKLQEQENRIAALERDIKHLHTLLGTSQQHASGGAQ